MTLLSTINAELKNWWLFLVKGLVFLAAGIYIFSQPLAGYVSLSILFSMVILVSGFSQIFFASMNSGMKGWGWTLISGIIDVVIGLYLLSYPLVTMATLPLFLGFWLVFRSFFLMGISFELKSYGISSWGLVLIGGILLMLVALYIIYNPAAGVASIIAISGTAFFIGGIFEVMLAFKIRQISHKVDSFSK
jgi:uncharacterized membrane protein HdeD (DUF308 family)